MTIVMRSSCSLFGLWRRVSVWQNNHGEVTVMPLGGLSQLQTPLKAVKNVCFALRFFHGPTKSQQPEQPQEECKRWESWEGRALCRTPNTGQWVLKLRWWIIIVFMLTAVYIAALCGNNELHKHSEGQWTRTPQKWAYYLGLYMIACRWCRMQTESTAEALQSTAFVWTARLLSPEEFLC